MIRYTKRTLIVLLLIQIIFTYYLTYVYGNNFFVKSVIIALIIQIIIFTIMQILLMLFALKNNEEKSNIDTNISDTELRKDEMYKANLRLSRKKRIIIAVFIFTSLLPISVTYYEEHSIKKISNVDDFKKIYDNIDGEYYLTNDIDFTDINPIYDFNECNEKSRFEGVLNGKGYKIKNLSQPLFYCIGKKGVIIDIDMENVNIEADKDYVGALAKINYGLIHNIDVSGDISGNDYLGGIVGANLGEIDLSSFSGKITGKNNTGGISGTNNGGIITRTYFNGEITGENYVGGITGSSLSYLDSIVNCYSNANITGNNYVGGIAGTDNGGINQCYVIGDIHAEEFVGILASKTTSYLSFFIGNIYGDNYKQKGKMYFYEGSTIENYVIKNDYIINNEQLLNKDWYTTTLYFDESKWDFSVLENGYLPIIKDKESQILYKITD